MIRMDLPALQDILASLISPDSKPSPIRLEDGKWISPSKAKPMNGPSFEQFFHKIQSQDFSEVLNSERSLDRLRDGSPPFSVHFELSRFSDTQMDHLKRIGCSSMAISIFNGASTDRLAPDFCISLPDPNSRPLSSIFYPIKPTVSSVAFRIALLDERGLCIASCSFSRSSQKLISVAREGAFSPDIRWAITNVPPIVSRNFKLDIRVWGSLSDTPTPTAASSASTRFIPSFSSPFRLDARLNSLFAPTSATWDRQIVGFSIDQPEFLKSVEPNTFLQCQMTLVARPITRPLTTSSPQQMSFTRSVTEFGKNVLLPFVETPVNHHVALEIPANDMFSKFSGQKFEVLIVFAWTHGSMLGNGGGSQIQAPVAHAVFPFAESASISVDPSGPCVLLAKKDGNHKVPVFSGPPPFTSSNPLMAQVQSQLLEKTAGGSRKAMGALKLALHTPSPLMPSSDISSVTLVQDQNLVDFLSCALLNSNDEQSEEGAEAVENLLSLVVESSGDILEKMSDADAFRTLPFLLSCLRLLYAESKKYEALDEEGFTQASLFSLFTSLLARVFSSAAPEKIFSPFLSYFYENMHSHIQTDFLCEYLGHMVSQISVNDQQTEEKRRYSMDKTLLLLSFFLAMSVHDSTSKMTFLQEGFSALFDVFLGLFENEDSDGMVELLCTVLKCISIMIPASLHLLSDVEIVSSLSKIFESSKKEILKTKPFQTRMLELIACIHGSAPASNLNTQLEFQTLSGSRQLPLQEGPLEKEWTVSSAVFSHSCEFLATLIPAAPLPPSEAAPNGGDSANGHGARVLTPSTATTKGEQSVEDCVFESLLERVMCSLFLRVSDSAGPPHTSASLSSLLPLVSLITQSLPQPSPPSTPLPPNGSPTPSSTAQPPSGVPLFCFLSFWHDVLMCRSTGKEKGSQEGDDEGGVREHLVSGDGCELELCSVLNACGVGQLELEPLVLGLVNAMKWLLGENLGDSEDCNQFLLSMCDALSVHVVPALSMSHQSEASRSLIAILFSLSNRFQDDLPILSKIHNIVFHLTFSAGILPSRPPENSKNQSVLSSAGMVDPFPCLSDLCNACLDSVFRHFEQQQNSSSSDENDIFVWDKVNNHFMFSLVFIFLSLFVESAISQFYSGHPAASFSNRLLSFFKAKTLSEFNRPLPIPPPLGSAGSDPSDLTKNIFTDFLSRQLPGGDDQGKSKMPFPPLPGLRTLLSSAPLDFSDESFFFNSADLLFSPVHPTGAPLFMDLIFSQSPLTPSLSSTLIRTPKRKPEHMHGALVTPSASELLASALPTPVSSLNRLGSISLSPLARCSSEQALLPKSPGGNLSQPKPTNQKIAGNPIFDFPSFSPDLCESFVDCVANAMGEIAAGFDHGQLLDLLVDLAPALSACDQHQGQDMSPGGHVLTSIAPLSKRKITLSSPLSPPTTPSDGGRGVPRAGKSVLGIVARACDKGQLSLPDLSKKEFSNLSVHTVRHISSLSKVAAWLSTVATPSHHAGAVDPVASYMIDQDGVAEALLELIQDSLTPSGNGSYRPTALTHSFASLLCLLHSSQGNLAQLAHSHSLLSALSFLEPTQPSADHTPHSAPNRIRELGHEDLAPTNTAFGHQHSAAAKQTGGNLHPENDQDSLWLGSQLLGDHDEQPSPLDRDIMLSLVECLLAPCTGDLVSDLSICGCEGVVVKHQETEGGSRQRKSVKFEVEPTPSSLESLLSLSQSLAACGQFEPAAATATKASLIAQNLLISQPSKRGKLSERGEHQPLVDLNHDRACRKQLSRTHFVVSQMHETMTDPVSLLVSNQKFYAVWFIGPKFGLAKKPDLENPEIRIYSVPMWANLRTLLEDLRRQYPGATLLLPHDPFPSHTPSQLIRISPAFSPPFLDQQSDLLSPSNQVFSVFSIGQDQPLDSSLNHAVLFAENSLPSVLRFSSVSTAQNGPPVPALAACARALGHSAALLFDLNDCCSEILDQSDREMKQKQGANGKKMALRIDVERPDVSSTAAPIPPWLSCPVHLALTSLSLALEELLFDGLQSAAGGTKRAQKLLQQQAEAFQEAAKKMRQEAKKAAIKEQKLAAAEGRTPPPDPNFDAIAPPVDPNVALLTAAVEQCQQITTEALSLCNRMSEHLKSRFGDEYCPVVSLSELAALVSRG